MNEQPNFKETYTEANNLLANAERKADAAMSELPKDVKEKMRKMYETEKLIDKKAGEIIDILVNNQTTWESAAMKSIFGLVHSPLSVFPPKLGKELVQKLISLNKWGKLTENMRWISSTFIISVLGEEYGKDEEKMKRENNDTTPIEPLSFVFSEGDLSGATLDSFGLFLPEHVKITFTGNTWNSTGYKLQGGVLIICGNTSSCTGLKMHSGIIEVRGNAGRQTGDEMFGGTLNITGEVEEFDESAFSQNQGTIIWKGITLWNNGWTPEGLKMKKAGEIPGISADS